MSTKGNCHIVILRDSELPETDCKENLIAAVKAAYHNDEKLRIQGSGSKSFYGNPVAGTTLDVTGHCGVLTYEPSELVITARAGTRLADIDRILTDARQILGFEPPWFGEDATIGGAVACGLSGPRRPFAGSVRDFVLGINCINGKGEYLSFGGQVIKNVAGYDVSRLMVGALGALGVICEVSLKVLPRPEVELTRVLELDDGTARKEMVRLARLPLPLSGLSYYGGLLRVRLSGTENGIRAAESQIGGEVDQNGTVYWQRLKEQQLNFFYRNQSLWRLSVAATAPTMKLDGDCLLDWGGAQRWIYTDDDPDILFNVARRMGGHATMFKPDAGWPRGRFSALEEPAKGIHSRIKSAFDPKRILNSGILYADC